MSKVKSSSITYSSMENGDYNQIVSRSTQALLFDLHAMLAFYIYISRIILSIYYYCSHGCNRLRFCRLTSFITQFVVIPDSEPYSFSPGKLQRLTGTKRIATSMHASGMQNTHTCSIFVNVMQERK